MAMRASTKVPHRAPTSCQEQAVSREWVKVRQLALEATSPHLIRLASTVLGFLTLVDKQRRIL